MLGVGGFKMCHSQSKNLILKQCSLLAETLESPGTPESVHTAMGNSSSWLATINTLLIDLDMEVIVVL